MICTGGRLHNYYYFCFLRGWTEEEKEGGNDR